MGAGGERRDAQFRKIDGQLARYLHRIHVHRNTELLREGGKLLDGLNRTGFVIGPHAGGKIGRFREGAPIADMPAAVHGEQVHGGAGLGKLAHGIANRWVLNIRRNDAVGISRSIKALDSDIIRLGTRGGKDDLDGFAPKEGGDFLAGIVKHGTCPAARGVLGAGVERAGGGNPCVDGGLAHRLGCCVVEIVRHYWRAFNSSVRAGAISCRSPTTPRSAIWKNGSSWSWLTTTMVPEVCMPEVC